MKLLALFFLAALQVSTAQAFDWISDYRLSKLTREEFLLKTFVPQKSYILADEVAAAIQTLPEAEQQEWLKAIGAIYRKTPKRTSEGEHSAGYFVSGRRMLDRVVMIVARDAERFEADYTKNLDAAAAYRKFLDRRRAIFHIDYNEADAFKVARILRKELIALKGKVGERWVLLAGSFINGKAEAGSSDMDIALPLDPKIRAEVPNWQKKIGDKFDFQIRKGEDDPAVFLSRLNPVIIAVTPDHIQIRIYYPGGLENGGESAIADGYYSYTLE